MRIQKLSFNAGLYNNRNKIKNINHNKICTPNFKGEEYEYKVHWYDQGTGPVCIFTKNGADVKTEGRGSMYDPSQRAVEDGMKKISGGAYNNVKVQHVQNSNACSGLVYIADPEENITEDMYRKYDFIATEERPKIPTLEQLRTKFRANSDSTNYNEILDTLKDYYVRMLTADLKQKAYYEIKQLEDEKNLQIALGYKGKYESELQRFPGESYATDELNKQKYYIYRNTEDIRDDKEKIAYYDYKNARTREKIDFINNLEAIINKTGGSFIERDLIAHRNYQDERTLDSNITRFVNLSRDIEMKRAEKQAAQAKIDILRKEVKRLENQRKAGNNEARQELESTGWPIYSKNKNKEEIDALIEEIKTINQDLHKLKSNRTARQHDIASGKVTVARNTEELNQFVKGLEPIYQELESYYQSAYPFNE